MTLRSNRRMRLSHRPRFPSPPYLFSLGAAICNHGQSVGERVACYFLGRQTLFPSYPHPGVGSVEDHAVLISCYMGETRLSTGTSFSDIPSPTPRTVDYERRRIIVIQEDLPARLYLTLPRL